MICLLAKGVERVAPDSHRIAKAFGGVAVEGTQQGGAVPANIAATNDETLVIAPRADRGGDSRQTARSRTNSRGSFTRKVDRQVSKKL